jgi:hypothetical protein
MFKVRYIALLVVVLMVMACGGVGRSVEVHDVPQSRWYSAEEFYYENEDTLTMRDMSIVVRYGAGYVADSVALRILSVSPDSMVFEEPFTLHIPHLGDMRPEEHTFLYRRNVVFGSRGRYTFRIHPEHQVEGISSVGLIITEPQTNE